MSERKKFLLRLPPRLHEELKAWAAQEMRSLNGQIEYLLYQAALGRRKSAARDLTQPGSEDPHQDPDPTPADRGG